MGLLGNSATYLQKKRHNKHHPQAEEMIFHRCRGMSIKLLLFCLIFVFFQTGLLSLFHGFNNLNLAINVSISTAVK